MFQFQGNRRGPWGVKPWDLYMAEAVGDIPWTKLTTAIPDPSPKGAILLEPKAVAGSDCYNHPADPKRMRTVVMYLVN